MNYEIRAEPHTGSPPLPPYNNHGQGPSADADHQSWQCDRPLPRRRQHQVRNIAVALVTLAAGVLLLTGCNDSDADVAARNISKAAEQFEVPRRIVFINGITDKYLLEIDGYCSVETADAGLNGALEVTCKIGDGKFKKTFLGLSDNVSYMVEQTDPINVSTNHYRVIFKPETIVPDFETGR